MKDGVELKELGREKREKNGHLIKLITGLCMSLLACVCAPVFLSSWAPSGLYLGFTVTDRIILRLILIMVSRGSS